MIFKKTLFLKNIIISALFFFSITAAFAMPPHPDMDTELRLKMLEFTMKLGENALKINTGAQLQIPPFGTYRALVLMVDFPDNVGVQVPSYYENLLFSLSGIPTGSMRDYYLEVSYNQFDIIGDVNTSPGEPAPPDNWYRMPNNYAFYVNGEGGVGPWPNNVQFLVEQAIEIANPFVDYSLYDNTGDDEVDSLFFIHAGAGFETTENWNDIWSHQGEFREPAPSFDGVTFKYYSIEPEFRDVPGDSTIGVFCHEYGHVLGLPDLYQRQTEEFGTGPGIGNWGLMGTGSWNGDSGDRPAHLCAWSKIQLEWLTPEVILENRYDVNIPQVETNQSVFRLWTKGVEGPEYFLVENRQRTGFDDALPEDGLLIYHVDDSVNHAPLPRQINPFHFLVNVEQADGLQDLNARVNRGDVGDPWPGDADNIIFNVDSIPNSRDYFLNNTLVAVENISDSAEIMVADLIVGVDDTPPVINSLTANPATIASTCFSQMVDVTITADVTDNSDPNPICRITEVTCNQSRLRRFLPSRRIDPEFEITGDMTLRVNTQNMHRGFEDKIFTITVQCTDNSGNISNPTTTTVTVRRGFPMERESRRTTKRARIR